MIRSTKKLKAKKTRIKIIGIRSDMLLPPHLVVISTPKHKGQGSPSVWNFLVGRAINHTPNRPIHQNKNCKGPHMHKANRKWVLQRNIQSVLQHMVPICKSPDEEWDRSKRKIVEKSI